MKTVVFDSEFIENANEMMLIGMEAQFDAFGKTYSCNDGKVSCVETRDKIILPGGVLGEQSGPEVPDASV